MVFRPCYLTPVPPPTPKRLPPHPIRDTLFLVLLLVIFTLAARVFVVEAYAIPTGSMAPTLVGLHRHATCPACGHGFDVGNRGSRPLHCPLCHRPVPMPGAVLLGDRLLVAKFPARPHRFDVVVFRDPQAPDPNHTYADAPGPNSFFIKRVIGLPGEAVYLLDGHIFVQKPGADTFKIARRTDPAENPRWAAVARTAWRPVAKAAKTAGQWTFAFDADDGLRPAYDDATLHPYNQPEQGLRHRADETVEDLRLAARTDGGAAELAFSTPFEHAKRLSLELGAGGRLRLLGDGQPLGETKLAPGQPVTLELWLMDHEALAFADGDCVLRHPFDLPWAKILASMPPPYPGGITATGTLAQVELSAALPYLSAMGFAGRGGLTRDVHGRVEMTAPVILPDGSGAPQACWFCLGDNSPASTDGRFWNSIHPDVQERLLGGHAFGGLVPEDLLVGRAWGVVWPADENGAGWKPQFSKMRRVR